MWDKTVGPPELYPAGGAVVPLWLLNLLAWWRGG